jgi:hypothetical protein
MRALAFCTVVIFHVIPVLGMQVFDMDEIRDPSTLGIEILQDWHKVKGSIETRQKLVSINVGDLWPGQEFRVPVRMVVPANTKAQGFHLTGGSHPSKLQRDLRPNLLESKLLAGGVGLVITVIQSPKTYGQGQLGKEAESRFSKTLNPRFKIQYWAWPATLMRAITTAYAEVDHVEKGKIALSGGSKNGASPSMAILHDKRMTAVHATVSPIWDSPLRLNDDAAWKQLRSEPGRFNMFSGGHFGPCYNDAAMAAGQTWKKLKSFKRQISDAVFISRNMDALEKRGVEMLFHPGSHDSVAYDIHWGGLHHPSIPVYLGANSGHGKKGHPNTERDQQNKAIFMLKHFFPNEVHGELLTSPKVKHRIRGKKLEVTVSFPKKSNEESGRIWWMFNRAADGSSRYLNEMIPDDQTMEMKKVGAAWKAKIDLRPNISHIDFFSNHRKTLQHGESLYKSYLTSPYTRVKLKPQ